MTERTYHVQIEQNGKFIDGGVLDDGYDAVDYAEQLGYEVIGLRASLDGRTVIVEVK